MTAPASASKSRLSKYYFHKLSGLSRHFSVICLCAALFCPLVAAVSIIEKNAQNAYDAAKQTFAAGSEELRQARQTLSSAGTALEIGAFISDAAMIVMIVSGFFILLSNFRYLHSKIYSDTDLSLPLSDRDRFFGDFLSGLTVYIVPQIICAAAGMILWSAFVGGEAGRYSETVFQKSILAIVVSLLFYCSTLFTMSLCGKRSFAIVVPAAFNLVVPVGTALILLTVMSAGYGTEFSEINSYFCSYFLSLTPLGLLLSSAFRTKTPEFPTLLDITFGNGIIFFVIAVTLLYAAAAYLSVTKRRHERLGSPYVYPWARHIMNALMILCVFSPAVFVMFTQDQNSYSMLFFSAYPAPAVFLLSLGVSGTLYFVTEHMSGALRKAKAVSIIRYICTAAASVALCCLLTLTDGLGRASYVPAAQDISRAWLECGTLERSGLNNISAYGEGADAYVRLNRRIVSERPSDGRFTLRFVYKMKNGETLYRNYSLPGEMYSETINAVFESGAFASSYSEKNSGLVTKSSVSVMLDGNSEVNTFIAPRDLYAAMEKDAAAATPGTTLRSPGVPVKVKVRGTNVNAIGTAETYRIYPSFENTVRLFEENGFDIFEGTYDYTYAYIVRGESTGDLSVPFNFGLFEDGFYSSGYDNAVIRFNNIINTDAHYLNENVRELTDAQASELCRHCSSFTVYDRKGEAYLLLLIRDKGEAAGQHFYERREFIITEDNVQRAAAVFDSAKAPDVQALQQYIEESEGSDEYYYD